MRNRVTKDGFSVHAIAGTEAIIFGFDATDTARKGLLGFAIKKISNGDEYWLKGFKTFEETTPDSHKVGDLYDSSEHPIQDFVWSDYVVSPGTDYEFKIYPVKGSPNNLNLLSPLTVEIRTESPDEGTHGIYFNMGAIASQAFARNFGNVGPTSEEQNDPTNEKVKWLSRGLLEAALAFIAQAKSNRFSLRVAAYEFSYPPIMNALLKAHQKGADVKIVYEAGDSSTTLMNESAIDSIGFNRNLLLKRKNRKNIPHNKFIILLDNGHPVSVWGGSTNFTPSGFLGQSNVGHVVRDQEIAKTYLKYWEILAEDKHSDITRAKVMAISPNIETDLPKNSTTAFFSPRPHSKMLDWYANKVESAEQTVMFTAAFGVNRKLAEKFAINKEYLRFVLMEMKSKSEDVREMMRSDGDVEIALGDKLNQSIREHQFDGWKLDEWFAKEQHYRWKGHIFYVHTKYLMTDILTDDPKIFTGSANFSGDSLLSNDENMLLIRGDKRVADIYLTEFFRLFRHFYFRNFMRRMVEDDISGTNPSYLEVDSTIWQEKHFTDWKYNSKKRVLFR
jgi:hypothetical protein